jgi:hypothetical protein
LRFVGIATYDIYGLKLIKIRFQHKNLPWKGEYKI